MYKLILAIFVSLCPLLSDAQDCTPTSCLNISPGQYPSAGNPILWNPCLDIRSALARSIRMSGLNQLITPIPNWSHCHPTNCVMECEFPYCPETYCEQINSLAELKPSFIFEAYSQWGQVHNVRLGTPAWEAALQVVCDINSVYDRENTRRPIIQASILEHVDENISAVVIPQWVKERFDVTDHPLYSSPTATFNYNKVKRNSFSGSFDITRKEAQMWVYYLGVMYIDAGYTALHLGNMLAWGEEDYNLGTTNQFPNTSKVVNYLREYTNKRILISTENPGDLQIYSGNPIDKKLIFDFDNVAMRPREIFDYSTEDYNTLPETNIYDGTPCEGTRSLAYIDEYFINNRRTHSGGWSPQGCYFNEVPFIIAFDFGPGIVTPDGGQVIQGAEGGTYGYDDTYWFGNVIDRECAAYFLESMFCHWNDISNGYGFLQISGTRYGTYYGALENDPSDDISLHYSIFDDPLVEDAARNVLEINTPPQISISSECYGPVILHYYQTDCGEFKFREFKKVKKKRYRIKVLNPDCSSVYTIHGSDPNGNYLPSVDDTERLFYPTMKGTHSFTIRQDNKLIAPYGVDAVSKQINVSLFCCLGTTTNPFEERLINGNSNDHITQLNNEDNILLLSAYPNPTPDNIELQLFLIQEEQIKIILTNSFGQTIKTFESSTFDPGEHTLRYDLSDLPSGVYFLNISSKTSKSQSIKLNKID